MTAPRTLEICGTVYHEYIPRSQWSEETFNTLGVDTTKQWLAVDIAGSTVNCNPSADYISKGSHVFKAYRNRKSYYGQELITKAFVAIPGDANKLVEITNSIESVAIDPLVGGGDNFKITVTRRGGWEVGDDDKLLDFFNVKIAKALAHLVKIYGDTECAPFKIDTPNSMFPYKFDLLLTKASTSPASVTHLYLFSDIEIRGGHYDYEEPDEGSPYHLDTLWGFCRNVVRDRNI